LIKRTHEFQKQLVALMAIFLLLVMSMTGITVSVVQSMDISTCFACVFEGIGNWWNGLDTVDQLAVMGTLFALGLLFTGPWGALTFALTAGDLLGTAKAFGTFLRNPRGNFTRSIQCVGQETYPSRIPQAGSLVCRPSHCSGE